MPFRDQEFKERCVLCQKDGSACENCGAIHCEEHLLHGSCTACHSTLWKLERSRFHAAAITASLSAIPAAAASLLLALSSTAVAPLGFVALGVIAATGLFLKKRLRPMIHNSLERKLLAPASQRLLPAPPEEGNAEESRRPVRRERPRGLRREPPSRRLHFKFRRY